MTIIFLIDDNKNQMILMCSIRFRHFRQLELFIYLFLILIIFVFLLFLCFLYLIQYIVGGVLMHVYLRLVFYFLYKFDV